MLRGCLGGGSTLKWAIVGWSNTEKPKHCRTLVTTKWTTNYDNKRVCIVWFEMSWLWQHNGAYVVNQHKLIWNGVKWSLAYPPLRTLFELFRVRVEALLGFRRTRTPCSLYFIRSIVLLACSNSFVQIEIKKRVLFLHRMSRSQVSNKKKLLSDKCIIRPLQYWWAIS